MTLVSSSQISRREASIGEQAGACDIARLGTRKVGDKAGDLVCIAIALEGCDGNKRLGEVAVRRIHVGINRAWLDIVNCDSTKAEVSGESLREAGDRALGECIDRTADERHALAVGAANVNDPATFAQMPRGFLSRNKQAAHIDSDQLLKVFEGELLVNQELTVAFPVAIA